MTKMVSDVHDAFGRIDILVNNAGMAAGGGMGIEDMEIAAFDRIMAVNVRGLFLVTRAVLPIMYNQKYGRIINTSSQTAYRPCNPGFAHYVMTKGAINACAKALTLDICAKAASTCGEDLDVRINTVAPGVTMTPILQNLDPSVLAPLLETVPRGKFADIDEVVPSYVFLASKESRHMMGQCISPNGGEVFL